MDWRHWSPMNWESCLGKLETAYQKHYLKTDVAQTRFASLLAIALSLYFIRTDYLFFGYSITFRALLLLRGAYLVANLLILARLSRPIVSDKLRMIMTFQLWSSVFYMSIINITRPRDYMDYSTINMIFLFGVYLFNSLAVRQRFYGAFLFTAIEFINLNTKLISPESWFALACSYAVVNTLGVVIAVWFVNNRRNQFLIWSMERKHRRKVEKLSNLDPLTGVKNRRFFLAKGASEMERAFRYDRPLSLAIIDIDGLKHINDTHGHPLGDKALRTLVKSFKINIRRQDVFARLGGDEFGLLMPETNCSDAHRLVKRIKLDLDGRPLNVNGVTIHMTFSAGLAESKQANSLRELVHIADKKLYQAKNGGRNQVTG